MIYKAKILGFNWGSFSDNFIFFPRVQYNNIILSKSYWNFKKLHIEYLYKLSDKELMIEIVKWRNKYSISHEIIIKEGDNKLYINLDNILYVKMFLKTLQHKSRFVLEEFLYSEYDSVINDEDGNFYANEFIFSLYRN